MTALHMRDEAHVYRTSSGRRLLTVEQRRGYALAISGDGRYLATATPWDTTIWSVPGGRKLATLLTESVQPRGLAFTPSARRLVVRSGWPNVTLQVWDIAAGESIITVPDGGPFVATASGIIYLLWRGEQGADERFEVRRIGTDAPLSVVPALRNGFSGYVGGPVRLDPSGRYVVLRDKDPTTGESALRFLSATSGDLLATRVGTSDIQFTAGGDYLFTKGPNDGLALYRTEEYLNIPSDELTPRNKALTAWGHVKRSQLLPNYPNPFNPETWIPFDLAASGPVHIAIYDASGAVVRRVDLGHVETGVHRTRERAARWDGRDAGGEPVASGVYTYRVTAPGLSDSGRMLLIK